MIKFGILICFTTHLTLGKVITVNNASSNTSHIVALWKDVCVDRWLQLCNILIYSNTVINITSSSVTLRESVNLIRPDNITNITITGNDATIMCNNSGSVYCQSCDDVLIEEITWDQCGNPYNTFMYPGGVVLCSTANVSLINCTFQHSQAPAVTILGNSGNVTINHCSFLSNICHKTQSFDCDGGGGLDIRFSDSLNLIISDCHFYDNRFYHESYNGLALNLVGGFFPPFSVWNVTISKTKFVYNNGAIKFHVSANASIHLLEVIFCNNNSSNTGLSFALTGKSRLMVSNSLFSDNINFGSTFYVS